MLPVAAGKTHSWDTDADDADPRDVAVAEVVVYPCVLVATGAVAPAEVVAGNVSKTDGTVVGATEGIGAATGVGPGAGQFSFASSSVSMQPSSTIYRQQKQLASQLIHSPTSCRRSSCDLLSIHRFPHGRSLQFPVVGDILKAVMANGCIR